MPEYSKEFQRRMGGEFDELEAKSPIRTVIKDYKLMRDELRALCKD